MLEKSKVIFQNVMSAADVKKAENTKKKFARKYGDDSDKEYRFGLKENAVLAPRGTKELVFGEGAAFGDKTVFIGNIRMGFGHYRISMAMASCARAMGYEPVWLDLNSFKGSTCTSIISVTSPARLNTARHRPRRPFFSRRSPRVSVSRLILSFMFSSVFAFLTRFFPHVMMR